MTTTTNLFREDLEDARLYYTRLLQAHGDTPQAVAWRDVETQERRMAVLTEIGDLGAAKVLDFGCGTGHLLAFLQRQLSFKGEYVGYDLSAEMLAAAQKKFPEARFEQRNVLADPPSEEFDYILINGVFNRRMSDNWGMMTSVLERLFPLVRRGLSFNALSSYVEFEDPDLFYVSPETVFHHCKTRLSPCVCLRHDYQIKPGIVPYEFTVYVFASSVAPVAAGSSARRAQDAGRGEGDGSSPR